MKAMLINGTKTKDHKTDRVTFNMTIREANEIAESLRELNKLKGQSTMARNAFTHIMKEFSEGKTGEVIVNQIKGNDVCLSN